MKPICNVEFTQKDQIGRYLTLLDDDVEDYAVIQALLIPSEKQAIAHKKVMTSSLRPQNDGNCSIVHAVQHTYIWITF